MGTYTGTALNDTITPETVSAGVTRVPAGSKPSTAADTINGLGGNDTINGGGGADILNGGDGNDKVYIDLDTDNAITFIGTAYLYGGSGNDVLWNRYGGWDIDLSGATFKFYGQAGDDRLEATYHDPYWSPSNYGAAKDYLYGGTGNDSYVLYESTDVIVEKLGEGYDSVVVCDDDYTLPANVEKLTLSYVDYLAGGFVGTGNELDNVMIGTEAGDVLDGRGGNDTIYGKAIGGDDSQSDADVIHGGAGNDQIYGGRSLDDRADGPDTIFGNSGNDTVWAGGGDDTVYGGPGEDKIYGQSGNDRLFGGNDRDWLGGGTGADRLYGEGGPDILFGRDGADRLSGGGGNDRYDYDYVTDSGPGAASRDVILDFAGVGAAIGDRIDLATIDANTSAGGNQAFAFRGTAPFTGAGQIRVLASGADTLIQANTGGTLTPELEILVKDGAATPGQWVAGDFIL